MALWISIYLAERHVNWCGVYWKNILGSIYSVATKWSPARKCNLNVPGLSNVYKKIIGFQLKLLSVNDYKTSPEWLSVSKKMTGHTQPMKLFNSRHNNRILFNQIINFFMYWKILRYSDILLRTLYCIVIKLNKSSSL